MDDCHGRQGRKINSHERGCSHVYSSRKVSYVYTQRILLSLSFKHPNVGPLNCTGAQLNINASKKKKRIHEEEEEEAQKAGVGLCCVGLECGPPLRPIPSFIIHAAIYCTHIQYTHCASHCTAHKLGQGVAATGAWELAQARIVTVSV